MGKTNKQRKIGIKWRIKNTFGGQNYLNEIFFPPFIYDTDFFTAVDQW